MDGGCNWEEPSCALVSSSGTGETSAVVEIVCDNVIRPFWAFATPGKHTRGPFGFKGDQSGRVRSCDILPHPGARFSEFSLSRLHPGST